MKKMTTMFDVLITNCCIVYKLQQNLQISIQSYLKNLGNISLQILMALLTYMNYMTFLIETLNIELNNYHIFDYKLKHFIQKSNLCFDLEYL